MRKEMISEEAQFSARGVAECKAITRRYGTSFYFATQFFPAETRNAIYAIYAFARIPDEIVDDPNKVSRAVALGKLKEWRETWLAAMSSGRSEDAVMDAIVRTFHKCGITVDIGEAFLKSMFMDEERDTYE